MVKEEEEEDGQEGKSRGRIRRKHDFMGEGRGKDQEEND